MKPITRNLFTVSAEIHAPVAALNLRLPQFEACGPHQRSSWGFVNVVPDEHADTRVLQVPGGWAVCLREDTRMLPRDAVQKAVEEKALRIEQETGRKPGKVERKELVESCTFDLLPQAFVRARTTVAVYSARTQRLFINTSSQKAADKVVTALVHAPESVKTSTVHVSEPKMGLTKRLSNWFAQECDDDCFGEFEPVDEVVLSSGSRKWAVKSDNLVSSEVGIAAAILAGATVDSIGFVDEDGVRFRITAALRLKGVKHNPADAEDDTELHTAWASQLGSELGTLDHIFDVLLDLLSPEKAQADIGSDLFAEA